MIRRPPRSTLFPSRRSSDLGRLYDGEVAYTDQQLGRLFAAVAKKPPAGNTLIAVLSDHGESLAEHGERSEEHTSELQSPCNLVCRLLLEKKKRRVNMYSWHS